MALDNPKQDLISCENPDYSNPKILDMPSYRHRRTPLVVTIADPNIATVDIQKMAELGMNVVRFKMSHCSKGEKIRLLGKVDKATATLCQKHGILDWPLTTCVELKTCVVRTGLLYGEEDSISVKEGTYVLLTYYIEEFDKCTATRIFVDNPYIAVEVKVGTKITLGQDEIELICKKVVDDKAIKCLVTRTGQLTNMALVFVRGPENKVRPKLTKKDLQTVTFAVEYQVDMIIIHYAREKETIIKIKQYIGKRKRPILLAGLSTPQGLQNIDDLIMESDGIVFSREFLSYELDESVRYRLLHIQKLVCAKCQQAGKPFFISGGVLKTAVAEGLFYDNELIDVTNALLDGATGFVLKECHDVEILLDVIRGFNELCCDIEPLTNTKSHFWRLLEGMPIPTNAAQACAISCALLANQSKARVIIIPTVTGDSAKFLMRLQPACIVLTVSTKTSTTRRLKSFRCVIPMMFEGGTFKNWYKAIEARVEFAVEHAVKVGWLKLGDNYVTLQRGTENSAYCDMVRLWKVTISKKAIVECPDDTEKERRHTIKSSTSVKNK